MATLTPEKGPSSTPAPERGSLIVSQPQKLEGLLAEIGSIAQVSERTGEDRSSDMGGSGGGKVTARSSDTTGISPRDAAIAAIPTPAVMQAQLQKEIENEMRKLRSEASSVVRLRKPGAAYKLNILYSKIRRLSSLLAELAEASIDVLKRLFVRVFIDRQPIQ